MLVSCFPCSISCLVHSRVAYLQFFCTKWKSSSYTLIWLPFSMDCVTSFLLGVHVSSLSVNRFASSTMLQPGNVGDSCRNTRSLDPSLALQLLYYLSNLSTFRSSCRGIPAAGILSRSVPSIGVFSIALSACKPHEAGARDKETYLIPLLTSTNH